MGRDMGKAPAYIFDWVEQYSFSALHDAQQQEVLLYITAEDYDALHSAAMELKSANPVLPVAGSEEIKKDLLQRMQHLHGVPKQKRIPLSGVHQVWRAAAIILFMVTCGLGYYVTSPGAATTAQLRTVRDTIYITRAVPVQPAVKHDTIVVKERQRSVPVLSAAKNVARTMVRDTQSVAVQSAELIPMLPANYEGRATDAKGTSIKDDSLMRTYAFVTL